MPNPIKYSTGSETLALKKGNLYIGTGAVGKGPSETTGYYQGPNVPSGGYVIYMNKEGVPGNLSYHSAANDAQLISFTNSIAGQSYTGVNQCFDYYYSQNDKVLVNQDYPADYPYIVMDNLVLYLDAGITQSYLGSGTTWTDVNGLGPKNNGTLTNGPTFNSANGGSIVFDGVDDKIFCPVSNTTNFTTTDNFSVETFCYATSRSSSGMIPIVERYYWATVGKGGYGVRLTNYSSIKPSFFITGNVSGVGQTDYGVEATTTWQTNTWYHIVGTKNSSGTLKIYINGVLENTVITNNIIPLTSDDIPLMIAARGDTQDQYSNSRISVVRIYRKELSAAEVLQNYNAQKGRFGL
jgi:hypothetical protein